MARELQSEEALYYAALGQPPAERSAYLKTACGEDRTLLERVEALLTIREAEDNFLASPPFIEQMPMDTTLSEGPGTVIGRYKLLEKIGEGGMAVVYMAEQTEPIRRKVALKIIKLGMDTRQVIARFEAERQALALMDHPSIAKVLDAGATETGRPYFVMELVTGVSITEYCDKNSLSTKDRLALFLQVCHAMQHAHQKGIIHRDIKPSNVMVTHHDGKPVPKVIDFGIAKATNQKLTEKTLFTRYAHIIGTPAYMSPEQAELTDLDIDTRSDIYSLGVLLYELLTGTTPFSEEELRKAGYIEMQRVIREQEPAKPSTKLSTLGDTLTDIAKCRNCTPDLLRKAIRGDLDWIVMKSLEKDRVQRYDTASGMAEDIRRHLESEPVLARGPSITYRLRKFLHRHRVQVLVVLAVAVLIAFVVVILSIWNQDRLQLAEAERLQHKDLLDQARDQYAKAERDAALKTIQPILQSQHVGPEAQLLQAGILVDNRHPDEATTILRNLLGEQPEIAGAAHALLARILWESESLDAEKLQQVEEHRQKAEALLPETAEACFLRAMTAVTIKEQFTALDKALQLDSNHYESLRLRGFTYYASRKYEKMKDDALVMATLRPRDPLGYSLRAVALRELGKHSDAIAEYERAMTLTAKRDGAEYIDLATQRCETFLRMGDYQRVIAESRACLRRWPDKLVFQYHVFCALTALGDYDQAAALFRQIAGAGQDSPAPFENWCAKYVFDTLARGRSWHAGGPPPTGAAFLPMVEAEEDYHRLSAKARRVTTDGFSPQWSPDGSRLAFSLGVLGYSGIAIYDPATQETDLLIVPGKDPKWSPDGKYIAFVRDRQTLRLEQLATAGREHQEQTQQNEELWVIRADGTEPQRLARGGWPSWSQDGTSIYYCSAVDRTLYAVSPTASDAQPKRIMTCSDARASVAPDGQQVAYFEGGTLTVQDLASQTPVARCDVSRSMQFLTAWSPSGKEVCLGIIGWDKPGLWVYNLERTTLACVLPGPIWHGSWSPDATKLVFCLPQPYWQIWVADLNPKVSTVEALGSAQTLDEHFQDIAGRWTRRIEAEPANAANYLWRAEQYQHLRQESNMHADIRRHNAILNQGFFSDSGLRGPWTFMRSFDGPAGRQLVVFVERRKEDGICELRIAFGQKGRCEMKSLEIPMVVTSLLAYCFLSGLDAPPARADFTFGAPTNVGAPINSSGDDYGPCVSSNNLELYFSRGAPGSLWVARRATPDSAWGSPSKLNLGPLASSSADDWAPSISADGLTLYFNSNRPGGSGADDLWMTTRTTAENDDWGAPVNLGATVNSAAIEYHPCISLDQLELYFTSARSGGHGGLDLWVTTRAGVQDDWGTPVNLGPEINTAAQECWAGISPDGLMLFFASTKPGGLSGLDLYVTRRATKKDPWGTPLNLGPAINDPTSRQSGSKLSPDGVILYFIRNGGGGLGGLEIWQAPIIPVMDFNGDSKVDAKDMGLLADNFGKSSSSCDIGPLPWGDGVVDERDLKVLMESLMTPGPKASDVPCDVVLNWISPSFAQTCDVYLGTSQEAVKTASRTNPQNVLVSQGQAAATYDPPGLLEFSKTYYWRVDFVISSPAPAVYQGPVLKFTTEAYAHPLKNVTATASSFQRGMGPEKTVDGSGLDKNDGHSTAGSDMWLSQGTQPHWIQYAFDKVYALHELWVWNSNQAVEPFIGFGAKSVKIEYSTDGTKWTALANVPEFARAPGKPDYVHNTTVSFSGVSAKYVKLTIEKGWGATPSVGLSEVRFFFIPDRSVPKP